LCAVGIAFLQVGEDVNDDGYDKGMVFACDEFLVFERLDGLQVPLWEVFELPPPERAAASGE
jgi:hypothetical protein